MDNVRPVVSFLQAIIYNELFGQNPAGVRPYDRTPTRSPAALYGFAGP